MNEIKFNNENSLYNRKNKKCCSCNKIVKYARDIISDNKNAFICPECEKRYAEDSVQQIWIYPRKYLED